MVSLHQRLVLSGSQGVGALLSVDQHSYLDLASNTCERALPSQLHLVRHTTHKLVADTVYLRHDVAPRRNRLGAKYKPAWWFNRVFR